MRDHDEYQDDPKFERWLAEQARGVNTPPALSDDQKDSMWAAIAAGSRREAGADDDAVKVVPLFAATGEGARPQAAGRRRRQVWYGAAAAALLVATGIGIGRMSRGGEVTATDSTQVATLTPADTAATGRLPSAVGGEAPEPAAPQQPEQPVVVAESPASVPSPMADGQRPMAPSAVVNRPTTNLASTLALARHLTQAEALLVAFAEPARESEADRAETDAKLAKWAGSLLTNTRILLDSPVADDPLRRRLLEDLELVLVQMVSLGRMQDTSGTRRGERGMIEGTLENGQVLPRLRTAIPVGTSGAD